MKRRTLATIEEVPAPFVGLANDRCEAITREWFNRQPLGLPSLTASCYLQGAADMAMAIEHRDEQNREQFNGGANGAD